MPEQAEGRHSPRLPLETDVEFRRHKQAHHTVSMHDLSASGCRIAAPEQLGRGERVWVQLPSLQSMCGAVRWTNAWQSGVEFERPMHAAVFDMMAARLAPAND
jgi:hypothetical protein